MACSLADFPSLPEGTQIPMCLIEGKVQYSTPDFTNVHIYTTSVSSHPHVLISNDVLHPAMSKEDSNRVFLPIVQRDLTSEKFRIGTIGNVPGHKYGLRWRLRPCTSGEKRKRKYLVPKFKLNALTGAPVNDFVKGAGPRPLDSVWPIRSNCHSHCNRIRGRATRLYVA
ncbi:hypothetical protein J6590_075530 [Homalodisca vitripennis]|nr:hypothetical protein J6590_075530 [Homalodisca vitripennis]